MTIRDYCLLLFFLLLHIIVIIVLLFLIMTRGLHPDYTRAQTQILDLYTEMSQEWPVHLEQQAGAHKGRRKKCAVAPTIIIPIIFPLYT
jgi:hypothetical protein